MGGEKRKGRYGTTEWEERRERGGG